MTNFIPFFYFDKENGDFGLIYNLESYYTSFIEMLGRIFLFFIVSFLVLYFVVIALKWVEKIVTGNDSTNKLFGGVDDE